MSSKIPLELVPIDEEEGQTFRPVGLAEGAARHPEGFNRSHFTDFERSVPVLEHRTPESIESDHVQKFTSFGLEIASAVIGNVLSHPCIVVRRQCQVNTKACRYHLSPFTLAPVLIRLQQRQSFLCLWKGCSGMFILRGCTAVLESFIAEVTPFPREVSSSYSLKQLSQHLLLKMITFGILTPFYCASLVETVQSEIASERPGVLDCLREGVCRLLRVGTPHSSRLLPLWQLVPPTALLGTTSYVLTSLLATTFRWIRDRRRQNSCPADMLNSYECSSQNSAATYVENLSILHFSSFLATVVLYPAETIMHRLYLQGTRTIIDNLDNGTSVLPVTTTYEGVTDCFNTILAKEGSLGLFKGLGALITEWALQAIMIKAVHIIVLKAEEAFSAKKPDLENIRHRGSARRLQF